MKKVFLLANLIFLSLISIGQTIDSKEYLTDVTKDIISTIEKGEDKDQVVDFVKIRQSSAEVEYDQLLETNFTLNNEDIIQLSVNDLEHFTPVITINNKGEAVLKLKNEALPMVQSDGTTVFYADSDKMISSMNSQVGVRMAVISINRK